MRRANDGPGLCGRDILLGLSPAILFLASCAAIPPARNQGPIAEATPQPATLRSWHYFLEVPRPTRPDDGVWDDLVLLPPVFDAGRHDLADLRLFDVEGREIPYDLRVRRPDYRTEVLNAKEFNRARGPNGSAELALDLGSAAVEHNEVELTLPGTQYRRHARLEGSSDGQDWRVLVENDLFHFEHDKKQLEDRKLSYPPSRFRFLRVFVERDPVIDKNDTALAIPSAQISRRVEVPGELLTLPGPLQPREPIRTNDGPGSAWTIDLGGNNVPCEQIACDIADTEFVRNYRIEYCATADAETPFQSVSEGVWRRSAGDKHEPMVAEFGEVSARRMRIIVTDASNPPLNLRSATFSAAARQVVFPRPETAAAGPLRLYVGYPKAYTPRYDFARSLPTRLEPPPTRRLLGPRQENPAYVPEPKPLTDRWPWLIYVVLGAVSAVLGLIIIDLARQSIARHDTGQTTAAPPP